MRVADLSTSVVCTERSFTLKRSGGLADSNTHEEPPLYAYATKQQNLHLFVHGQKVQMMTEYQTYFRNENENENYAVLYYGNENGTNGDWRDAERERNKNKNYSNEDEWKRER